MAKDVKPAGHQPSETESLPEASFLPKEATLTGDLETSGDVKINGRVEGSVVCTGTATINGTVSGNVEAGIIICSGTVKGDLSAAIRVKLLRGAFIRGDIKAPSVIRSEGASHNGKLIFP